MAVRVYDKDSEIPADKRLFVIRYPAKDRFTFEDDPQYIKSELRYGKGAVCFDNCGGKPDAVIFSVGEVLEEAFRAAKILDSKGVGTVVFDAAFFKPLDEDSIASLAKTAKVIATCEDAVKDGGFSEKVRVLLATRGIDVKTACFSLPNDLIPNDSVMNQLRACGISGENIAGVCIDMLKNT
jgi:1-deoxy-D-xylulose-5-phosphate synthase